MTEGGRRRPVLEARSVTRSFDGRVVLRDASLQLAAGDIHALLGPNGAGKTTLLRILSGLLLPTAGSVLVLGREVGAGSRALRQRLGLVPAGDRSFYLRLSGLENLLFFGRLQGLRKRAARERALVAISDVGLGDAARQPVGVYSHGMQKRLSVARALLTKPALLLVDEATHDLDPVGARDARDLIQRLAEGGTTVIWATQRLDEIRGFAHGVTLIDRGQTRFQGSVAELMAHAVPRHYLLRLRNGRASGGRLRQELEGVLAGRAALQPVTDSGSDHYLMTLADGVILGEALAGIHAANVEIISCQEERSEIEEAFLSLTRKSGT